MSDNFSVGKEVNNSASRVRLSELEFQLNYCVCLFIYGCARSLAARLSLVVVSGDYSWWQYKGFSSRWLLLLWSTGSRVHGLQYLQLLGSRARAQ